MRVGLGIGVGAASGASFSPTQLNPFVFLLGSVTKNGSNTASWNDLSGNGIHATQSNASLQPPWSTSAINGQPGVLVTNATSQVLSLPNAFQSLTSAEIFVVCRNANIGVGIDHFGTGPGNWYPFDSTPTIYDDFGSNTRRNFTGPSVATMEAPHLRNIISTPSEWTYFINGTQIFTTATNTVAWGTTPVICNGAASNSYSGPICAYALFPRKLSTSERAQMKSWAASLFALTLS